MLLTIRTLSCPPPDNPQNIHAQFGAAGGRIGRSPPCTLILPDPNRHISREHAEIRFRDNAFSIKVVSKVNSVLVNDAVVGPGEAVQLTDGDQILIGEYLLRADIAQPAAMPPSADALFSTPVAAPAGSNPFDLFSSLATPAAAAPPAELAPDWFRSPAPAPVAPPPTGGSLDDFFNPTADASRFSDVLHGHPPTSVPDVFAPPPPMAAPPVDNRLDQFLGLSDPLAAEPGAGSLSSSADLYRASPLDMPLNPAAMPVKPPVAAPLPPNAFASHDDIFKSLEQDFGAFGAPPPAAPAAPALPPGPEAFAFDALPLVPPPPPPPAAAPAGPAHEAFDPLAGFALPPGTPVQIPIPPIPPVAVPPAAVPAVAAVPVPPASPPVPPPAPVAAPVVAPPEFAALDDPPTLQTPRGVVDAGATAAFAPYAAAAPAAAVPVAASPVAAGDETRQLMHVLTEALGLKPGELDDANPEQTIRLVGELLRKSTDGLFRMLEMRSQLKSELHIEDRTMIASRENNPLKHADTARDAIAYLVDLRQHGNKLFMPPAKAVDDTVWDICAHEMAVMAGTRAALQAALKMFAPEVIEGRIKKTGALENVLPALHKSRLWERFLGMYAELQHEAEDHFDRLLNQEFSKAYSEQSKKLKKKR